MARWVFDVGGLEPLRRYRIDTDSATSSAATVTGPDTGVAVAGSVVQADAAGKLPRLLGGAATLYAKPLDVYGAAGSPVTLTGTWDVDARVGAVPPISPPLLRVPKGATCLSTFGNAVPDWTLAGTGASQALSTTGGKAAVAHTVVTLGTGASFTTLRKTITGTGSVITANGVDMTTRYALLWLMVEDPFALQSISFAFSLSGWTNYWSWSNQVWSTSQADGSANLEAGVWRLLALTYPQRALIGTATDPVNGATPANQVKDWQIAMTGVSGKAAKVHLGGLYVRSNGI